MNISQFQKLSGLYWEDKKEEIEDLIAREQLHLKERIDRKVGSKGTSHRLIEGDNLAGLQYLIEQKEEFDLIYIDPPYNTGNTDFNYKDSYLDSEDEHRHSTWISFMYKRLLKAKELLNDKGAIFISIDDAEHARLKLLCDGIFGRHNFVANFIRKNKYGSGHDSKQIAIEFDYVLCYAKNIDHLVLSKADADVLNDNKYRYSDSHIDRRGKYYLRDLDYKGSYSKTLDYTIKTPDGTVIKAGNKTGKPNTWRWSKEKFEWGLANDYIVFKKRASKWKVYIKQYQFVDNKDQIRERKIPHRAIIEHSNSKGSTELKNILQQDIFSYPKPSSLIQFIIELFPNKKIDILDFFAGSGTTLHAAMLSNQNDGGKRSCTLITNNENNICEEVTYVRNKKLIEGFTDLNGKKIKALKNNQLSYYKIDFSA